ncbi:MAG: MATE family efflux transporter [Kiritimatiellia bacterium]
MTPSDTTGSSRPTLLSGSLLQALARLSVPMLLSGALQEVQCLVDLFWVGRLGPHAVAAVSLSGIVIFLLSPVAMGLMVGTVALVSRRVGAQQPQEAGQAAAQSLLLAGGLGLLASVSGWFLAPQVFPLLGVNASDAVQHGVNPADIVHEGIGFLRIIMAGQWVLFILMACFASLQAAGNVRTPMLCSFIASVANMILDPLLIYGIGPFPRLGVPGAALATVLSQAIALSAALHALRRNDQGLVLCRASFRPAPAIGWRILSVGLPGSGQILLRSVLSAALMRIVAGCGPVAVAGYGIGLRWHMFILMPAFALGNAAATLVGQNLGARQPDRARHSAWLAAGLDAGLMVLFALLALVAAEPLVRCFTTDPEVVRVGVQYLRVVSPFYPAVAFGIILGRALNGAGDSLAPMIITAISLWAVQFPAAIILAESVNPPILGIWLAIGAGNLVHGLLILWRFRQGAWAWREV